MKIAIYGIGAQTEKELPNLDKKYNIVGLLDSFKNEGEIYGKRIISIDKAIELNIKKIIVLARPGSCKAIVKKIGEKCRENSITLMDGFGNDLLVEKKVEYNFSKLKRNSFSDLIKKIEKSEVVSFDLFDTLLVRITISREDLFDLVNKNLRKNGINIFDFLNRRIEIEHQLSRTNVPTLEEIYNVILDDYNLASKAANIEYDTDVKLLVGRKQVISALKYAKKIGKKVFITTDMYYSREKIINLLNINEIIDIDDILVSCEYRTSKSDKLFETLIRKAKTNNILHIGDDDFADISSAQKYGINTFKIHTVNEMFTYTLEKRFLKYMDSISNRLKIGLFSSNIFNNPFSEIEKTDLSVGKDEGIDPIAVSKSYDIGFDFYAPIIFDYIQWFGKNIEENSYKNIWFGARDGYLIKKLYNRLYPNIETKYFMISRTAAIRAGVENEKDIEYVSEMKFSGTFEEAIKKRFGINIVDKSNYYHEILDNAKIKRENYIKYIDNIGIKEGDIAFFDFVAKGTSQYFLQKLIDRQVTGLYFLQLEAEKMKNKNIKIVPFYTDSELLESAMYDNYYLFETVLTSNQPSVDEFDEFGNVIFAKETRTIEDLECVEKMQKGIIDYFDMFILNCPKEDMIVNKNLDEEFIKLIHEVKINTIDMLNLKVEDPFFNRETDIKDVL